MFANRSAHFVVCLSVASWVMVTCAAHAAQIPALEAIGTMIARTPVEGYAGCVNGVIQTDYADRLGEIQSPAIFICSQSAATLFARSIVFPFAAMVASVLSLMWP